MSDRTILCVDLGGTHCRYQIVTKQCNGSSISSDYIKHRNDDYRSFYESVEKFLIAEFNNVDASSQIELVVGLAGDIQNDCGHITNRGWDIDKHKLLKEFSFKSVMLLNDLEAAAWGVCFNEPSHTIYDKPVDSNKTGLVVGVGTGLGLAYFHHTKDNPTSPSIFATETGQSAFSPRDNFQYELHKKLMSMHGHTSVEYILSGSGLKFIHSHIDINSDISSADIIRLAHEKSDDNAVKSVEVFADILANVLGNLTLTFRPNAGIHLIGGMIERTLPWLQTDKFIENYCNQARMPHIPSNVPIFAYHNDLLALNGCLHAELSQPYKKTTKVEALI